MALDIAARRAQLRDRPWTPRTLHERLDECAAAYGNRPFVITDDRTISYAETAQWSRRLADGLAALGVRPGDRVGMLMANYLEFIPRRRDRRGWHARLLGPLPGPDGGMR